MRSSILNTEKDYKVIELLHLGTNLLSQHNIESPRLTTEILLSHSLGLTRTQLYLNFYQTVPQSELFRFNHYIRQKINRYPIQYITKEVDFGFLSFHVNENVFIPRPETELLLEIAIGFIQKNRDDSVSLNIIDLCTGTGVLAICLAKQFPDANVYATDISGNAIKNAIQNAILHRVDSQIEFLQADLFSGLETFGIYEKVDTIVCNPPYIKTVQLDRLPYEIKMFEPRDAIDGGPDGLKFYRKIIPTSAKFLKPTGALILELGLEQSEPVEQIILESQSYNDYQFIKDLHGTTRVILATKSNL